MLPLSHYLAACLSLVACLAFAIDPDPIQADNKRTASYNVLDEQGLRQGFWKITGSMIQDRDFKKDQVVEEGQYVDNKRNGIWMKYYPTGVVRSEINYENNQPRGAYRIFYDNGNLEEEGDWQGNRNVGVFMRYHPNGNKAQEFTFNDFGKRDGVQQYFYPNGKLQMTVEVENGTAHGKLTSYYPNGDLKSEKRIVNGALDEQSVRIYNPKSKLNDKYPEPVLPLEETIPSKEDKPNLVEFKDTGFNTLYNRNQQITQVGEFKEGRLWNGKWHHYDSDGLLRKVEVYKEGRYIGLGVIDEAMK